MALRLLLDEDIKSKLLVRLLRERGHDVATTADLGIDGQPDFFVLRRATVEDRIVLTYNCDDFRELHESDASHAGIILVYQEPGKSMDRKAIVAALDNLEKASVALPGTLHALNPWRY